MDNSKTIEYAALILAGGESSRMGRDKTTLCLNGRTMLQRMVSVLSPLVSRTVVVINQNQPVPDVPEEDSSRLIFVRDSQPKKGPLQAIVDGLRVIPEQVKYVYLTATDMPYVNTEWFSSLRDQMVNDIDLVQAKDKDITNPLLALYRKDSLRRADELLSAGESRPYLLAKGLKTISVEAFEYAPYMLEDMNRPEDFENAKWRLNNSNTEE